MLDLDEKIYICEIIWSGKQTREGGKVFFNPAQIPADLPEGVGFIFNPAPGEPFANEGDILRLRIEDNVRLFADGPNQNLTLCRCPSCPEFHWRPVVVEWPFYCSTCKTAKEKEASARSEKKAQPQSQV